MELKKNPKADLRKSSFTFLEVGLIVSLLLVLGAFNYTAREAESQGLGEYVPDEEIEIMENTVQEKKPPPPPPPPQLEIVEDDVVIEEEQPEIEESEVDQETMIEPMIEEEEEPEETGEILEFYEVSEQAQFKGGEEAMYKFIAENLEYPPMAVENEIEGRVMIAFVVEPNGNLSNIQILGNNKLGWGCEEAAISVVKKMSGMWRPAKQRDKSVRVNFRLPIRFKLY